MIDHLLGRPSERLKRVQVLLVLAFWSLVLAKGSKDGPRRVPLLRWINEKSKRFSPWQIAVFCLSSVYAIKHFDAVAGFGAPEPLARMYSRSFYRVTWIVTAMDAGFATAMNIRPKWIRDLASMAFSVYYLIYANEADEKLRRYRAFCTIEMMRATWEKTTNPYIRAVTWPHRPSLGVARPILLPRPGVAPHAKRPIRAWLFYAGGERMLREEDELVLDIPGGGFVCMNPQHHEERLRQLAKEMERPVLAIDYCKAPEYPYPFALEECYDVYRSLHESKGRVVGMSGRQTFRVIMSGDSAGGNLATGVLLKILEYPQEPIRTAYARKAVSSGSNSALSPPPLPKPLAMVLSYPALNLSFTSWMKPEHLRVLRQQSEVNLASMATHAQVKGAARPSPLRHTRSRSRSKNRADVVPSSPGAPPDVHRRSSTILASMPLGGSSARSATALAQDAAKRKSYISLANQAQLHLSERARFAEAEPNTDDDGGSGTDREAVQQHNKQYGAWLGTLEADIEEQRGTVDEQEQRAVDEAEEQQRRLQKATDLADLELVEKSKAARVNTRLTMTSMAGYFQDRILTQSMMRAMAILYIGPRRQPDFENDYFLSPIVAPARILAEFPPCLFICGEKDPICDDTVVMAGRIREAKLAKQAEIRKRRAGASARFGEQLRMSLGKSGAPPPDPIEDETVEDWVQMRIIEGWSHGFLQMSSLLPEAKQVISFLAAWQTELFDDALDRIEAEEAAKAPAAAVATGTASANGLLAPAKAQAAGQADADDEGDEEEPLSFTPRSRRSPSQQPTEVLAGPSPKVEGAGVPAAVASLRAGGGGRDSRPSSFSSPSTASGTQGAAALAAAAPGIAGVGAGRRSSSFDLGGGVPGAGINGRRGGARDSSVVGQRRGSKEGGATALDERYKALLVKESTLLQRRRDDATTYLGQSTSAVHDSESEGEGDAEEGETRGRSRA